MSLQATNFMPWRANRTNQLMAIVAKSTEVALRKSPSVMLAAVIERLASHW